MLSPTNSITAGDDLGLSSLEIHLDRICWNYLSLQKRLGRNTDCAAVVKADSYGLGARQIVPELYKNNCRHFFVAHASEGITVRAALKTQEARIYVLNGIWGATTEDFTQHNLIPVLNTLGDIEYWVHHAKKTGARLPAIIHVDTGMNRLGLSSSDVKKLAGQIDPLHSLDLRYIMSHLACADTPDHPKNLEQLTLFKSLTSLLNQPCPLSFANSAGIFLGTDYHFDLVRPGCGLYGIKPQNAVPNPLQGVITLKARILQIRNVDSGETVGYGASYKVPTPQKLATISAGYADGILRSFTEKGAVYIQGLKCPVVGRVSMDAIVVDVTQVTSALHVGDWAEIVGEHQTVDDVAASAKTIGYEVLTSLGTRYKRIYSGQGL